MNKSTAHVIGELVTYMDQRMEDTDHRRVRSHLRSCGQCQTHWRDLQSLRKINKRGDFLSWMSRSRIPRALAFGCALLMGWNVWQHRKPLPTPEVVELPAPQVQMDTKKAEPVKTAPPIAPVAIVQPAPSIPTPPPPPPVKETVSAPSSVDLPEWKGEHCGVDTFKTVIARTPEEWQKLWREHTQFTVSPEPLPKINFTESMVIGVYAGQKPTGGYAVEITSTRKPADVMSVIYRETTPTTETPETMSYTEPFHLKVIPRTTAIIQFKKA